MAYVGGINQLIFPKQTDFGASYRLYMFDFMISLKLEGVTYFGFH